MRLSLLAPLTLALAALGGCTCAETVRETRFACTDTSECLPGFACRGGECRSQDIPAGTCLPGDTQACAQASCSSVCNDDGGWAECLPSDGGTFEASPQNCGACGRLCSTRAAGLTCVEGRCNCVTDFDCPSGDVCGPGGLCVMNGDSCAKVQCPAGEVCRDGSCAPRTCAAGCKAGEVCDDSSGTCRLILPCRLPVACGDGGVCEGPAQPDGEPCDDGVACTANDSCAFGSCRGTAYSCPAPTVCQQSVACAGDGGCTVVPVMDGTSCDDGQACTAADQCVAGVCSGTTYACNPDQCAATSVCAGDGGCLTTPRNVGSSCDDGQACSFDDTCSDAGACEGTTYTCPGMTACKQAGVCLGDGGCDVVDKANGTTCDDGQSCTTNDSCSSGTCVGTPQTSYQDLDNDGRGNFAVTQQLCPLTAGYVLDGGDCDDSNVFVQQERSVVADVDQDGVTASTSVNLVCVGAAATVNGRNYFRGDAGTFPWTDTASATADCNDGDGDVFTSRPMMVTDGDRDGYSTSTAPTTICVGASMLINGRTYYANPTGSFVYLDSSAALGSGDCLDSDGDVFTSRSVARDVDQDGVTQTTTLGSQCTGASSTVNGRTYFADTAGAFTWLGTASTAADCNDANPSITGTTNYWADADGDGFGAGAPTARCMAIVGEVTNGTDCNDGDGDIHTTRTVATDADRDAFTTTTTTSSQCIGDTMAFSGRTYYADVNGAFTWLGTASTPVDCDDANAAVFPRTVYADNDGDGIGAGAGVNQCPTQSGFVTTNTDCNDASATVYRTVANLYDDADQDGYSSSVAASFCVGANSTVNGRTYYRNASNALVYTPTNLGADCNTSNGATFSTVMNVVPDNDRDGYPSTASDTSSVCAGATSTVGGRSYFANGSGGYWMPRTDCIERQGNGCSPSFVDCYDSNAQAVYGQTAFFTTNRGDGSFDYDCSGTTTANTTGAQYCASVSNGVTTYTDLSCLTTASTANVCNSPTAYSVPGACGRNLATTGTAITNTGTCATVTVAGTTVVGCR